jgi:hypothetical protein
MESSMTDSSAKPATRDFGVPPGHEIERASGGQANADKAAEAAPGERVPGEDLKQRQEALLDEAVEETFPASDPIAPKRIT